MTSYLTIYNRFLDKVTDYFIFELSDEDTCKYCHKLLMSALANLKNLDNNLDDIDDDNSVFNSDLTNKEIEYVACQMACEWLTPQINNTTLTTFYIGTKDEKFYSSSNQLKELVSLRDNMIARIKKIRRDYTYENSEYLSQ